MQRYRLRAIKRRSDRLSLNIFTAFMLHFIYYTIGRRIHSPGVEKQRSRATPQCALIDLTPNVAVFYTRQ